MSDASAVAGTTQNPEGRGAPRLHFLGDVEPPPNLRADLLRLLCLPAEALARIWQVLGPSLAETIDPATEQLLDVFCAAYKLDDDDLAHAIKACRYVVREGAQRDVPIGKVAEDLDRLCPDAPQVKELVLAGYEIAKERLRHDIVKAAVSDHGKLLVGLNWRLDAIQASERGTKLGTPVAVLTLHYREGGETGRVTLQVLPDMMGQLRDACEKMLR